MSGGGGVFEAVATRTIHADPLIVWDRVADPLAHRAWREELVDMTLESGAPGEVGAVYREVLRVGRRDVASRFRIVTEDEPRRFAFEVFEPAWIPSTNTMTLEAVEDGTLVRIVSENRTRGWRAVLDPVWHLLFARSMRRELDNLKRVCEATGP